MHAFHETARDKKGEGIGDRRNRAHLRSTTRRSKPLSYIAFFSSRKERYAREREGEKSRFASKRNRKNGESPHHDGRGEIRTRHRLLGSGHWDQKSKFAQGRERERDGKERKNARRGEKKRSKTMNLSLAILSPFQTSFPTRFIRPGSRHDPASSTPPTGQS